MNHTKTVKSSNNTQFTVSAMASDGELTSNYHQMSRLYIDSRPDARRGRWPLLHYLWYMSQMVIYSVAAFDCTIA